MVSDSRFSELRFGVAYLAFIQKKDLLRSIILAVGRLFLRKIINKPQVIVKK